MNVWGVRISTHTPHAGRNHCESILNNVSIRIFQLTRPMRGATNAGRLIMSESANFNSHAPCGAQPSPLLHFLCQIQNFNSHAPCGAQLTRPAISPSASQFQLTRPMRGATDDVQQMYHMEHPISTHTPHAGRNVLCLSLQNIHEYFNSHAPCGAQLLRMNQEGEVLIKISTHTPHAGRNTVSSDNTSDNAKFQLTRPMRGATYL